MAVKAPIRTGAALKNHPNRHDRPAVINTATYINAPQLHTQG